MTEAFLQNYGWVVVSLLGGLLVALMFVMGANLHLGNFRLDTLRKWAVLKATSRRWAYALAALVVFAGVIYFTFPLFFRAFFVGARRLWELVLVTFFLQLVAYIICNKNEKLLGSTFFCILLMINGFLAPLLVGTAIGTFFVGAGFTVDWAASPAAVAWDSSWRGLEMLHQGQAVLLGLIHACLSFILGGLYVIRVVDDHAVRKQMRRSVRIASIPLLVLSFLWAILLMLRRGFAVNAEGVVTMEKFKYLLTLLHYRPVQAVLILGAVLFALGLYFGVFTKSRRKGFWLTAGGTVIVVMGIFGLAAFNGTAFFPSLTDIQSSLTVLNSAADADTLQLLFWLSPAIPLALIGFGYLWHREDHKKKITVRRLLHEGKVD